MNLASVDGYSGDVEAGKTRDVHRIQLGSIEPPPHRRKSPSQCPMDRGFYRSAECLRRVRIRQPHKVPASASNSRVQLCCHGPHRLCPSLGKRLLTQSELTRQDTSISQEYRVDLHCCRLPGGLSSLFRPEPGVIGIEAEDTPGEESSRVGVSAEAGTLLRLAADLVPAVPSWLSGCILPSLMARRAAKCLSTSIFLMRPMALQSFCQDPLRPLTRSAEDR